MADDALPENPPLRLAQLHFLLSSDEVDAEESCKLELLGVIKEKDMAPYYEYVCKDLGWEVDQTMLKKMQESNRKHLDHLDEQTKDAVENFGEEEIGQAHLKKAEYYVQIGDKENAIKALDKSIEATAGIGSQLDIVFMLIRVGFFYSDRELISKSLQRADDLMNKGGDWDRRNRLRVYRGLFHATIRQFKKSSELLLEAVSTFTSYELMPYKDFILLSVVTAIISLPRPEFKKQIVHGPEVQQTLHDVPYMQQFVKSLYDCDYAEFFKQLAEVEDFLIRHRYLSIHRKYFVREMRIKAYQQLLESYRSLTLESMAKSFNVSVEFIDKELSRFVSAGRLHCKIDRVGGIVETNRPDMRNKQYQETVKKGDLLLNRIQKLSQVIHI